MNLKIPANFPFRPEKAPFFYGWFIIFIGAVGLLMSAPGQTIGVSTFTDSLIESLGISRNQLSLAYLFGTIISSFFLTRVGRMFDKHGARPIAILAAFLLAFGVAYLSVVDHISNALIAPDNSQRILVIFPLILVGFLIIRFSGQGMLTLASKTMMMKWFDKRRGFAMGFASVFASFFFSFAPAIFEHLIQNFGWRMAWRMIAFVLAFIFPIVVLIFFRNDPSESGLKPDGNYKEKAKNKYSKDFSAKRDYTLQEARKTFAFWIFALFLALQGLQFTGLTFHIVSVFEEAGKTRAQAVGIFPYIALVAVLITFFCSWLSDYIRLKYLLYLNGVGGFFVVYGIVFLHGEVLPYYALILGQAIVTSIYNVIGAVVWVRFYGKKELGAIVGQVMMLTVFGSALGPYLFSLSLSQLGSYSPIVYLCGFAYFVLTICTFWANNPQEKEKLLKDS